MSARYDAIVIGAGIIGACTAFAISIGFFSRLREVNRESSFSVLG